MAPSPSNPLHILFFPSNSPSHQTPLLHLVLLLSSPRLAIKTTVITATPPTIPLPGHVTLHVIPSPVPPPDRSFLSLHPFGEDLVGKIKPDVIVSDWAVPWTARIAREHNLPRILFYPNSVFSVCVTNSVNKYRPYMSANSDHEPFVVPGLPDTVKISRAQIPARFFRNLGLQEFSAQFTESENYSCGAVFNSFDEIEPEYIKHFEKIRGKLWAVGPLGPFKKKGADNAKMGNIMNRSSVDTEQCLKWLDSKEPGSVVYVCFGGLCVFAQSQLVEMGLGLEASKCNFIWVVREGYEGLALDDLEERVKDRGLIIKGWAPQLLILEHRSVGGFVSHCGWNSVLEAVSCGVPILAWPLFAEQFYNATIVVHRLRFGFRMSNYTGLVWGDEETAVALVKRDRFSLSVARLMGGAREVKETRERVMRLRELARTAASEGGSSCVNLDLLIDDLLAQKKIKDKGDEMVTSNQ